MSLRNLSLIKSNLSNGFLKQNFIVQQKRFARCHDIRYIQSDAKDAVIARYREKLEQKAKKVGASSVEELQEKLKDEIEKTKKEFSKVDPLKELEDYEAAQSRIKPSTTIKVGTPTTPKTEDKPYKTLHSFVDIEKVSELPLTELEFIWRARFQSVENTMSAVISSKVFQKLFQNARKNPSFILPLPKEGQGYEMHFIQWAFVGPNTTHCMITTVAEYKLHKEYAKPHTTLMFHQEMSESKEVVLMNGVLESTSHVTLPESQLLVMNVQRFYGAFESAHNERRLKMLRDFSSGHPDFSTEALIEEAISLEN